MRNLLVLVDDDVALTDVIEKHMVDSRLIANDD